MIKISRIISRDVLKGMINLTIYNYFQFLQSYHMASQNNTYPDVSNEPLLYNQNQPPAPRANNVPGGSFQQPYNNNGPYVPVNQGFNPNGNQGFNPNGNQGFNPNGNQGFNPNGNQGFQPAPPPFNPVPGRGLMCPFCRRETDNFPKKVPGGVTWIWCFGLFIFTGVCCCIPFCVDSCQDT